MDNRPNPDVLLDKIQQEAIEEQKGKLTIFFGGCAGVGKTYAMLNAAKEEQNNGVDVLLGLIETHGRKDTQALIEGLPILPPMMVKYKGTVLKDFDIDAALKRKPQLILIDELAHSNPPTARHKKRWQDVEELLAAGIDVFTTLNVQHLETLNDVVEEITGIRVWETVPDHVFDEANEIRLVDLPPDDLLERLEEGKVYLADQAKHAAHHFFRKGNLIALRELALRRTADRVDAQMRDYKSEEAIETIWNIKDRLMVCLGPHGGREKLIRTAARLAASLKTDWAAVYVETPELQYLTEHTRENIFKSLKLAESLGAETKVLSGETLVETLIDYAISLNVSKIMIGRSKRNQHFSAFKSNNLLNALIKKSSGFDFYVVGEWIEDDINQNKNHYFQTLETQTIRWPILKMGFVWGLLMCAFITLIAKPLLLIFDFANIMMLYVLGLSWVTLKYGRWPGIFTASISVLAFNFFLIPKRSSFFISYTPYLLTLAIMIAIVMAISKLTSKLQYQNHIAWLRERRTNALYRMTKALSEALSIQHIIVIAAEHLTTLFQAKIAILLTEQPQKIGLPNPPQKSDLWIQSPNLGIAQWVYDNEQPAGLGTETLPGTTALYLPLKNALETRGVLAIEPIKANRFILQPEQRQLLDTFATQIALAIDRIDYLEMAHKNN